jgi:hypothetical protein
VLPTFIIIGAMKTGTTSLHTYLSAHPEIGMSEVKELDFFNEESHWARGLAWYESQFPEGFPERGEASPGYTKYPRFPGVPERIASVVPDAKLIYMLRDPIARVVSHYIDAFSWGREHGTIDEVLAGDLADNHYVNCSRYDLQLSRYDGIYPPERILVITSEDLRKQRAATLRTVFGFLGVDDTFWDEEYAIEHYKAEDKARRTRAGYALTRVSRAVGRTRLRSVLPHGLARAAERFNASTEVAIPTPEVSPELRARLEDALRDDVARLRERTGMAFAGWSV